MAVGYLGQAPEMALLVGLLLPRIRFAPRAGLVFVAAMVTTDGRQELRRRRLPAAG